MLDVNLATGAPVYHLHLESYHLMPRPKVRHALLLDVALLKFRVHTAS